MQISLDIPDDILSAFASVRGWTATVPAERRGDPPIPNPITFDQAAVHDLYAFMKESYIAVKAGKAIDVARTAAIADAQTATADIGVQKS